MLVTDGDMLQSLKDFARLPEDAISGVLYASSLLRHGQVYTHDALYDPSGTNLGYLKVSELADFKPPAHPFANDGLTHPEVAKAWHRLACGDWSTLAQVATQAKQKGEIGEQAKLLIERADAYLAARKTAFDTRQIDLAAHVDGMRLVEQLSHSAAHKEAGMRLAELLNNAAKSDPLKSEMLARSAFYKLVPLQFSLEISEIEAASAGYQQLAAQYPDTQYGRQAQSAFDAMGLAAD